MARLLPALCFLLGTLLAGAEPARTFTSLKGIAIEAEISSATSTNVTLKLADGSKTTVGLDQLIPADREHIRTWLAAHVPDIRVTPKFVRSTRTPREASGARSANRRVQVLDMSIELETWDPSIGIDDGELKYILVGRSMGKRNQYKILAVQSTDFALRPAGQTTARFKTVQNFYDDNPDRGRGARCVGYVLYATRKSDGRELHASASSPSLGEAIPSIITLQAGEVTDDQFIKIPEPTGTESSDKPDIITVE